MKTPLVLQKENTGEAMDYELNKLEEMDTWKEIDESDVPQEAQVLPGMWVQLIKNLESGE